MSGGVPAPLGILLAPLGALYAGASRLRVAAYRRGWRDAVRPPLPTLSIGNIAAGGTGKTPLLLHAVAWLERHDARVGVLSRGYGGDEGRILEQRHPDAQLEEGADRVAGLSRLMERAEPPEVLLLDDGFQHLRLRRDLDVVVLDATRPFGRCFPAGLFREPGSALRRADLVVLSRAELVDAAARARIWQRVAAFRRGCAPLPAVEGGVRVRELRALSSDAVLGVDALQGMRARLAAGIGNPASFQALCVAAGVDVVGVDWQRDHHAWSAAEAAALAAQAPLLVTEKDGVKLRPFAPAGVWEVRVDWVFTHGGEHWEQLLGALHLPVRAARIEPLWQAHDPHGRSVR